jgi:hypothetical protein
MHPRKYNYSIGRFELFGSVICARQLTYFFVLCYRFSVLQKQF